MAALVAATVVVAYAIPFEALAALMERYTSVNDGAWQARLSRLCQTPLHDAVGLLLAAEAPPKLAAAVARSPVPPSRQCDALVLLACPRAVLQAGSAPGMRKKQPTSAPALDMRCHLQALVRFIVIAPCDK